MSSEGLRFVLGIENLEVVDNDITSAAGHNNVIHITALSSLKRISESVLVLLSLFFDILTSEDDLDRTLGSHNGNLGSGPSVVVVTIEMLG